MSNSESKEEGKQEDIKDLILELNFVPTWAREKPAAPSLPKSEQRRERGRGRDRDRDQRDRKRTGGGGRRDDRGAPRQDRNRDRDRGRDRQGDRRDYREAQAPRAPVRVDFIPNRDRLNKVVKLIRHTGRAYALAEIAERFMSDPHFHSIKFQLHGGAEESLYQCKETGLVFLDEQACAAHTVEACLVTRFTAVETPVDPPKGNFTCVGKCKPGGELVGPPNYHGFKEAVEKLRREKYPDQSADRFRRQIEMSHEEADIEAWKQSRSVEIRYRLRAKESGEATGGGEGTESEPAPEPAPEPEAEPEALTRKEAAALVREQWLPRLVVVTRKAIMPGSRGNEVLDERLARSTREGLTRESRHPMSIILALRPALKHMHLHLFRTGKDAYFVTAIKPTALHGTVVEDIAATLEFVREHPGCKKEELVEKRFPGEPEDAPGVVALLSSVRWLVERGHVIEFFDGALAVPKG